MLTKDELKERKNSIWGYSRQLVYEIIESHLEIYDKLEKTEAEIDAWRNDAILMSDKRRAKKVEAELTELREAVREYFDTRDKPNNKELVMYRVATLVKKEAALKRLVEGKDERI